MATADDPRARDDSDWVSEIEQMLAEIGDIADSVGDEFWDSQKGMPFEETLLGGLAKYLVAACRAVVDGEDEIDELGHRLTGLEIQLLLQQRHGRSA